MEMGLAGWSLILSSIIIIVMIVIFSMYIPNIIKNTDSINTNTDSINTNTDLINSNTAAIAANSDAIKAMQLFLTTPTTILSTNTGCYLVQSGASTNMGSLTFNKIGYWQVYITMMYVPATPATEAVCAEGTITASNNGIDTCYYGLTSGIDVIQLQFGLYETEYNSTSNTSPTGVAAQNGISNFLLQENIPMLGYNAYTLTFLVKITKPTTYYNISYVGYTIPENYPNAVILGQIQNSYAILTTI